MIHTSASPTCSAGRSTRDETGSVEALLDPRLERAIVIYRPETELASHYFRAVLPRQFDAVIHFDHTRAVEPLDRTELWEAGEPHEGGDLDETYPTGL